jgi:hypothetical protein
MLLRGRRGARSGGRAAAVAAAVCLASTSRLRVPRRSKGAMFRRQKRYVCSRGPLACAFVIRWELGGLACGGCR